MLLGGCSQEREHAPVAVGTLAATPTLQPAPLGVPEHIDDEQSAEMTRDRVESLTSDPQRSEAAAQAVRAMTAFARTDLPASQWLDGLRPYLTDYAQMAYDGTDPTVAPFTAITGPATVVETDTDRVARIDVPTNTGSYLVILSRQDDDVWRVERFIPPPDYAAED